MKLLGDLPNIGKILADKLNKIGIITEEELCEVGAAKAVYKISNSTDKECLNMLYALEGAIKGIRWHNLTKEEKEKVRKELDNLNL